MSKVMFITSNDLFCTNGDGGAKGSQKNYKLLTRSILKNDIKLICIYKDSYEQMPTSVIKIKQPHSDVGLLVANMLGCRRFYPWKLHIFKMLTSKEKYDLVWLDSSNFGNLVSRIYSGKTVVFFHNIEADYMKNKYAKEGLKFLPAYWAAKHNEKLAMKADYIVTLNERDAHLIKDKYGRDVNCILPIAFEDIFDVERANRTDIEENSILFCGSCFGPNIDGIEWFIHDVLPLLENTKLVIVGKGFESKKEQYEAYSKQIEVVGTVDDTSQYYYTHSIVVMPIRYGTGMKVKTAEAMMFGKIILATDEALEGYDVEEIDGIFRCNNAQDFINAYKTVKSNKKYYDDIRKLFLDKYSINAVQKVFDNFLKGIVE